METEAKEKVVASVWGSEFIQVIAAMAILPQSIWKNRMNSSFSFKSMIWWKGWSVLGLYEEKDELHKDDMKKRMNLSYSSNWPGAKYLVRQGIEYILSPK